MRVTCSASIPRYLCRTLTPLAGTSTQARSIRLGPSASAAIPFNTILDGQGHTIANLNIDATAKDVGLFAVIGSAGQVRNLNLTDVHLSASGSAFVGALAGENRGMISDVHVLRSTIIAQSELGVTAGGLVGVSSGFIREFSSAATVHVGDSDPGAVNIAGGLSGSNHGDITSSSTTGEISGGAFSLAGGMVGQNFGRLEGSFAAGGVTGGASTMAGGLVGMNASGATIRDAYAVGNVTGGSSAIAGGLVGSNAADSLIENSYATGIITAGRAASAGELVGQNLGDVSDAYAAGAVTVGDLGWGGGLIGRNTGTISGATVPGVTTICGAGQTLPAHHRDLGRGRRGERDRGTAARAQSQADAGRHPPHPDRQRAAARNGRARRQFRRRPDWSAQGAATRRSADRDHDAARRANKAAVARSTSSDQ